MPKKPEFPFKKLNFISKIGAGSYGTVLLAKIETEKKEEKEIAIKIISVKTKRSSVRGCFILCICEFLCYIEVDKEITFVMWR